MYGGLLCIFIPTIIFEKMLFTLFLTFQHFFACCKDAAVTLFSYLLTTFASPHSQSIPEEAGMKIGWVILG